MNETRRQKRVASLVKEELSRLLITEAPHISPAGLITVTDVNISADLKTAHIDISVFGVEDKEAVVESLNARKGYFRKCVASRIKIKYNPLLHFRLDPSAEITDRLDQILKKIKKNDE